MPPYFCDVVAPVGTFGRGSPTGIVCYRHTQFPEHYRGGLFLLDWTFGKVYFVRWSVPGRADSCRKELFLECEGDNGFAPTAVVVHPVTGDLFISIGGRGTRGGVYRIRHPQGFASLPARTGTATAPPIRGLDRQADLPRQAESGDAASRLQALIGLRRFAASFPPQLLAAGDSRQLGRSRSLRPQSRRGSACRAG